MSSGSDMNKISVGPNESPVVKVTVYNDRAQVSRHAEIDLKKGLHKICITNFVDIVTDTIRVEGKGSATILDVSYETEPVDKSKEKELKDEIERLTKEKVDLNFPSQFEILAREKTLLDQFFTKAAQSGVAPNMVNSHNVVLSDSYLTGIRDYMKEYRTMAASLSSENDQLKNKEKEIDTSIADLKDKLRKLQHSRPVQPCDSAIDSKRRCAVVVDAHQDGKIQLTVSYMVCSATWVPSYDLRMETDQGILKFNYYGMIRQHSGEDWNGVSVELSTALPCADGSVPEIPITHLAVCQPILQLPRRAYCDAPPVMRMAKKSTKYHDDMEERMWDDDLPMMCDMVAPEVRVVEKTTSTSYEIGTASTIPSDNETHKVTVAVFSTSPDLSYVTVPKASPNAFLRAKVTNTSPYMLLAGDSKIYLDNTFVANTPLSSVAPKEEFVCSLGIDPAVRVTYKPVNVYKTLAGLINKTQSTKYEQDIEVKNLHNSVVKILIQDSLPKSMTEKIKVNLITPAIDHKHPEKTKGIRLTKNNALEWDLTIKAMETKAIGLVYTVEHSPNERVEIIESCIEADS